jgi:hypothetical protein
MGWALSSSSIVYSFWRKGFVVGALTPGARAIGALSYTTEREQ